MSKKNDRKKHKEFAAYRVQREKEILDNLERKRLQRQVNKQAKSVMNSIENFGLNEKQEEQEQNDVVMKTSYRRPIKAKRLKKRHREMMLKGKIKK